MASPMRGDRRARFRSAADPAEREPLVTRAAYVDACVAFIEAVGLDPADVSDFSSAASAVLPALTVTVAKRDDEGELIRVNPDNPLEVDTEDVVYRWAEQPVKRVRRKRGKAND